MRLQIFDKKRSTTTEIPQPIFTQLSYSTLFLGQRNNRAKTRITRRSERRQSWQESNPRVSPALRVRRAPSRFQAANNDKNRAFIFKSVPSAVALWLQWSENLLAALRFRVAVGICDTPEGSGVPQQAKVPICTA